MKNIVILLLVLSLSGVADADAPSNSKNFDSYVNGALGVYSQFKTPSKEESEKFYNYINAKWTVTNCISDCMIYGYATAKEYVNIKKIPVEKEKQ